LPTIERRHEPLQITLAREAEQVECFALRRTVFVDEQGVPDELERDEHDALAAHWIARRRSEIVGTARARVLEHDVKAERVAVRKDMRGSGVGRALMSAIETWARTRRMDGVRLNAQSSAVPFYEILGYTTEGDPFEEAGIPHRNMYKRL
jgi:predicted GNAT family N-acyltransferase